MFLAKIRNISEFLSENYHFFSREILQYFAGACLRNGRYQRRKIAKVNEVLRFESSKSIIHAANVKFRTIGGILTFMSRIDFMLRSDENEKSFTTSSPEPGRLKLTGEI